MFEIIQFFRIRKIFQIKVTMTSAELKNVSFIVLALITFVAEGIKAGKFTTLFTVQKKHLNASQSCFQSVELFRK